MRFSVEHVRSQFSALEQKHRGQGVIFMDGPGGSQVPNQVLLAMRDYLGRYNSNLGGHFFASHETVRVVDRARQSAACLLNAPSSDNIVFGANMTSLTFTLSRSISRRWQAGDEVIVTDLDHFGNVSAWVEAAKDKGAVVHRAKVCLSDGSVDLDHLLSQVTDKTKLIAITLASNTTGSVVDVKRLIEAIDGRGIEVYVDAVHYAPHHLIDVQSLDCDYLVCSAYKFFGPHLGVAYVAQSHLDALEPYKVLPAPDKGPARFETGTLNFEALAGFSACVEFLAQYGSPNEGLRQRLVQSFEQYETYEQKLSAYMLERLEAIQAIQVVGREGVNLRTPTFALVIDGVEPLQIAKALGEQNICVWSGHFYAIGLIEALGLSDKGGVLRVGLMHYNTTEEIDAFVDAITLLLK
ncbi:cysteine desulfurase-like protein [Vibrio sp. SCSIO 43136]|uniref:cysteine desulfurase-like protein n=1 Tax=Vibrio sp. SCSIO 43136 TaxID=2819101 RepID=UPI002075EE40|nr:cysteine desulfurase-like protein [Vibrio sp. SCSIO 43136]USD64139.1 cysteine desulfurase-like protein [Vibrio sp. SCSIO 43136]